MKLSINQNVFCVWKLFDWWFQKFISWHTFSIVFTYINTRYWKTVSVLHFVFLDYLQELTCTCALQCKVFLNEVFSPKLLICHFCIFFFFLFFSLTDWGIQLYFLMWFCFLFSTSFKSLYIKFWITLHISPKHIM